MDGHSDALLRGDIAGREGDGDTRAGIYARTSSTSQRFGYSIDEQVRQCLQRCLRLGWDVPYVFRDEAESGKNTERPMFQTMMDKAEASRFDVLVFWKLDRFSRSLMHAVQLEAQLREEGVALHSVTEQIDTTTSTGRFNFRNIASAAEFERDMIKDRSQMGLKALALEHRWPNDHPPLGYLKADDGTLLIDEDEAELVERIFREYIEVRSMPQLAHDLNQEGVPTKRGNEWTPKSISDVLKNELYVGHYAVSDVEEYVERYQIVDNELFESAEEVRKRFRSASESEQPRMPKNRKRNEVEQVVQQYKTYLKAR
jgi:site-specific DNA recombinase